MKKIEFKVKVVDGIIKVPQEHKELYNTLVSVTLTEENADRRATTSQESKTELIDRRQKASTYVPKKSATSLDFSTIEVRCFKNTNPIEYQRSLRDGR